MCLSKNIRFLRLKKNYSQEYVAEKLGYKSYTTIQKWESGVSEPSVAKLRMLADIFGVDMNDLTTKDLTVSSAASDGVQTNAHPSEYYIDAETRKLAQELHDNPELSVMLDAYKTLSPRDAKLVMKMVRRMQNEGTD